jgi:TPR repeat protein
MFERGEPRTEDLWLHPIEAIPPEMRRKRARYQLAAIAVLGAVLVALAAAGVLPARTEMAAVDAPMEKAVRAYARGDYLVAQSALLAAARAGDAEAQELLGVLYAAGHPGIRADVIAAGMWLDRAAANGRPTARALKCALLGRTENRSADAYCF